MNYYDIVVVGAGASGVMAAISVKLHHPEKKVLLLDRQDKILSKVRASGNGRCNLSNKNLFPSNFYSIQSSEKQKNKFVQTSINQFNFQDTKDFFSDLGLFLRIDEEGRAYPYAEQAELVIDFLSAYLDQLKVKVLLNSDLDEIKMIEENPIKTDQDKRINFKLHLQKRLPKSQKNKNLKSKFDQANIVCEKLILACGSSAAKKLGGSHAGYELLHQLNVKITDLRPALVPLILAKEEKLKTLKGQRFKGQAILYKNQKLIFKTAGEFLFTEKGLSGIAAMEIARYIEKNSKYHITIDFIPDLNEQELKEFILRQSEKIKEKDFSSLAKGFVRKNIAEYIAENTNSYQELIENLKALKFEVIGTLSAEKAQIMAGGVILEQIDFPSFSLKKNPNIYICGELLDIDGKTGGFNLQWAWTSGYLAGQLKSAY